MSGIGGVIHERVMLDRLERAACEVGAQTQRQAPAGPGRSAGHIDLLLRAGDRLIAIEAELTAKRIARDVAKAAAVGAHELWIVVPNGNLAAAVIRRLRALGLAGTSNGIFVLTLGLALKRIGSCFPFSSGANVEGKTNQERT